MLYEIEDIIELLIYSVGATMWIICPQVLLRWADYFGIRIEDKPLEPLFKNEEEKNKLKLKRYIGGKHDKQQRKRACTVGKRCKLK